MKLEGCNGSDLPATHPKVDYEADIGVRSLLEGERWKEKQVQGNLLVDRQRDVCY